MGLYLPNIEMPEHGEMLVIIQPNGIVKYKNSFGSQWTETNVIQIPPHGRLIDADALIFNIGDVPYKGSVKRVLLSAPTIALAEGDG